MRDHEWLENQLQFLLKKYFSGVKISNPIEIKWGREAKYRFGSIRLVKKGYKGVRRVKGFVGLEGMLRSIKPGQIPAKSLITITSMFVSESIPIKVVQYTICHELCHYAHGFSSTNKKMFKHPHHGGVINRELSERGAEDLISEFKAWLKEYRKSILAGR